jgi:hypothetical protein
MHGLQNMNLTVISKQKKREKNLPAIVKVPHTALFQK